jgi:hypothetical protein
MPEGTIAISTEPNKVSRYRAKQATGMQRFECKLDQLSASAIVCSMVIVTPFAHAS